MEQRRDARRQTTKYGNGYIGDNLARRLEDPYVPEYARPETQRKRKTRTVNRQRPRLTAFDVLWISVGVAVVFTAIMLALTTVSTTNSLNVEITEIEEQISELQTDNDARQYIIESSLDLDYISQVATEELGMVRSSLSQIVTYESLEEEFIQQVAEIPED